MPQGRAVGRTGDLWRLVAASGYGKGGAFGRSLLLQVLVQLLLELLHLLLEEVGILLGEEAEGDLDLAARERDDEPVLPELDPDQGVATDPELEAILDEVMTSLEKEGTSFLALRPS